MVLPDLPARSYLVFVMRVMFQASGMGVSTLGYPLIASSSPSIVSPMVKQTISAAVNTAAGGYNSPAYHHAASNKGITHAPSKANHWLLYLSQHGQSVFREFNVSRVKNVNLGRWFKPRAPVAAIHPCRNLIGMISVPLI